MYVRREVSKPANAVDEKELLNRIVRFLADEVTESFRVTWGEVVVKGCKIGRPIIFSGKSSVGGIKPARVIATKFCKVNAG